MTFKKAILIFLGTLCVGLGVLGIFLPLMPTTVFLLMAAYCYSKSSDKFHTWLLNNRWLGSYIKTYKSGQGITLRQKATSITMLWASILFSIWMINGKLWVSILLAAIAIAITIHLLWIKTHRPETDPIAELTPIDDNVLSGRSQ